MRDGKLLRVLGPWEGAAIGIGVAIGAGIFRLPGYVAGHLPEAWMVLAVWGIGWLLVFGDSLILSELGTRFPRAGGWYVYIKEGYGRFPAFVYGWAYTLVVDPASSAALVVILGEYMAQLCGWTAITGKLSAIGITLGVFLLQLAGVRLGSRVQDALTYTKLLLLVGVGVFAFLLPAAAPSSVPPAPMPPISLFLAMALALQGVLWTFEGYANFTTLAGETKDPRRTLPRALIFGTLALGATYLLVNAAYLHVLGRDALAASTLPGADMCRRLFGMAGERIFLMLAIFVALGSLNGAALSAPRVAYALSRSGLAPAQAGRVNRLGTPHVATLWFALAWSAYAWFGTAGSLVAVSIFVGALANVAVTATVFLHRRRDRQHGRGGAGAGRPAVIPDPGTARPAGVFRTPLYPVLPALLVLVWGAFAGVALASQGWGVGYGLLLTLLAIPAYFLFTKREEETD